MIIDMGKFLAEERKYWTELERILDKIEGDPLFGMDFEQAKEFHYLYQRTSADLAKGRLLGSFVANAQPSRE